MTHLHENLDALCNKRSAAASRGDIYYYTGKHCKFNHRSPRYTSSGICVQCLKTYSAAERKANPEKSRERRRKWTRENPEKVKKAQYKRYHNNPQKEIERSKIWKLNNPDKAKIISYRSYVNNKETMRARNEEWKVKNREKYLHDLRVYRLEHKEKIKQQLREWRLKNLGKCRAIAILREAIKLQATPSWINKDRVREIYERSARLTKCLGIQMHVDHIIPLRSKYVCGLHCEDNMRIIPAVANIRKLNREWPDMTHWD